MVFLSRVDISIDEMTELVWGPPANTDTQQQTQQQEAAASGGGGGRGSGGPSSSSSSVPSVLEGLSITERRRSVAMLRNGSYGGKERTEALSSTLIETSNKFYQDRLGTNTGNTFFTKPEEQSQNKTPLTNPLQEKTPHSPPSICLFSFLQVVVSSECSSRPASASIGARRTIDSSGLATSRAKARR